MINSSNFPSFPEFQRSNEALQSSAILNRANEVSLRVQTLLEAGMDTTPEQFELTDLLLEAKQKHESETVIAKLEDMINELIDPTLSAEFEADLSFLEDELETGLDMEDNEVHIAAADRLNDRVLKHADNRDFRTAA